ncbi:MAG: histidinol dehydrogenase [Candidatus Omnitrophica bacterium CG12_big_fil_rev_8_21_14_0_65_42_8]|nr:MAG: histidinol dehydrogenase [Candidatus Omnitrophica bacterium CG12_big_fil_rev_8_21_14_0_65_42_8]
MKILKLSSKEIQKLCERYYTNKRHIEEKVRKIIYDVRDEGDKAVIKYTKRFDKVKLTPKDLKVSINEINGSFQNIDTAFIASLKDIIENIQRYYKKELPKSWKIKYDNGAELGEIFRSVGSVGIYVPAGTAPLVSSVYMSVVPARMAGVKKIVIATPPNKFGNVDPYILAVANLLKVDEIYKIGGAQAISALAFGTKSVPKVDKIVGPGNEYVTEAKRQVFGFVDIDMLAGPSEVVILANQFSDKTYVTQDLLAQAEHFKGLAVLVTTSKKFAKTMKNEDIKGYIVLARNIEQAVEVINRIAPEHLEILIKNPNRILKKIQNAGAIFIGSYSPVCIGDYVAGPSHILPTGGTARFFSGLGTRSFLKSIHTISYSKKALENEKAVIEKMTKIEGLDKHLESFKVRFK